MLGDYPQLKHCVHAYPFTRTYARTHARTEMCIRTHTQLRRIRAQPIQRFVTFPSRFLYQESLKLVCRTAACNARVHPSSLVRRIHESSSATYRNLANDKQDYFLIQHICLCAPKYQEFQPRNRKHQPKVHGTTFSPGTKILSWVSNPMERPICLKRTY